MMDMFMRVGLGWMWDREGNGKRFRGDVMVGYTPFSGFDYVKDRASAWWDCDYPYLALFPDHHHTVPEVLERISVLKPT